MSARKVRPAFGTPVLPGMSIHDVGAALGVSMTELGRWINMAHLSEDEFESRISQLRAAGVANLTGAAILTIGARGRVGRALGIVRVMTRAERALFITELMGDGW